MSIEFSWRYCVIGVYADRNVHYQHAGAARRTVRIYPLPFVRISVRQF